MPRRKNASAIRVSSVRVTFIRLTLQCIILTLYYTCVCTIDHIELVVVTGCSSGLGRETVKNLLATDKYHVIGAVRDVDKMEAVAEIDGFNMNNFHIMDCELNSFASVHKFCEDLKEYQLAKPIDRLICNAGGEKKEYIICLHNTYFC